LWNDAGSERLQGGHLVMDVTKQRLPLATAAPGMR
jgi:hypothetical protein